MAYYKYAASHLSRGASADLTRRLPTQFHVCICLFFLSPATATSKDLSSIPMTRSFTGRFAFAPVSNTGGDLGDVHTPALRAAASAAYAMATTGGPLLALIAAGAMLVSDLIWTRTKYIRIWKPLQDSIPMMALSQKQYRISPLQPTSSESLSQRYSARPATRDSSLLGTLLRDAYPRLKHRNRLVPSGTPLVDPAAYQCKTRIEALIPRIQVCMAVVLDEIESLCQVSRMRLGWP